MNKKDNPLIDAVVSNDTCLFNELIAHGINVNDRDEYNVTALWYAAQDGQTEMVELLLVKGAEVDVTDIHGNSPLAKAVYWYKKASDGNIIKMLIRYGADINLKNKYGVSPLDLANMIAGFPYLDLFK